MILYHSLSVIGQFRLEVNMHPQRLSIAWDIFAILLHSLSLAAFFTAKSSISSYSHYATHHL